MKLRNKKTGRIITSKELLTDEFIFDLYSKDFNYFNSKLDKIKEEWEEYEEDELLYVVSAEHRSGYQCVLKEDYPEICKVAKEFGIGFGTEKECQKAVEKLKAWKRLKDKGFRFKGWRTADLGADKYYFVITAESDGAVKGDLDLLFGGKYETTK